MTEIKRFAGLVRICAAGLVLFAVTAIAADPKDEKLEDGTIAKTEYYDSGKVRRVTRLDDDKKIISVTEHDEAGSLVERQDYDNAGRVRGKTRFAPSGKSLTEEVLDENGALHSLKEFDADSGEPIKLTLYNEQNRRFREVIYKGGKPEKGREFFVDGNVAAEDWYDSRGEKVRRVEYDSTGNVYSRIQYK